MLVLLYIQLMRHLVSCPECKADRGIVDSFAFPSPPIPPAPWGPKAAQPLLSIIVGTNWHIRCISKETTLNSTPDVWLAIASGLKQAQPHCLDLSHHGRCHAQSQVALTTQRANPKGKLKWQTQTVVANLNGKPKWRWQTQMAKQQRFLMCATKIQPALLDGFCHHKTDNTEFGDTRLGIDFWLHSNGLLPEIDSMHDSCV